jgi:YHS domain-containing protein
MKAKCAKVATMALVMTLLTIGLVGVQGCKEKSEPAAVPAPSSVGAVAAAEIVQKTCPIMGAAIDEKVFIEHKGKKVYFCCPGCEDKFKADPEKHMAKLPQFKD